MTENPTTNIGTYDLLGQRGQEGISFSATSGTGEGLKVNQRSRDAFGRAAVKPVQPASPANYKDQNLIGQLLINLMMMLTGALDPDNKNNNGLIGMISKAFGFEDDANHTQFRNLRDDVRTRGRESVRDGMDFSRFDRSAALAAAREGQPLLAKNAYGSQMLELIGKHESAGDYNRVFAHKGIKRVDLTNMTLNEVLEWQSAYVNQQKAQGYSADNRSSAAGKYQVISGTLRQSMKELGLRGDEKFDERMQDRIGMHLLQKRGYSDYLEGRMSERKFLTGLSSEWASLPKDASGRGVHDGVGTNRASAKVGTVLVAAERDQGLSNIFETARTSAPPVAVAATTPERTRPAATPAPALS